MMRSGEKHGGIHVGMTGGKSGCSCACVDDMFALQATGGSVSTRSRKYFPVFSASRVRAVFVVGRSVAASRTVVARSWSVVGQLYGRYRSEPAFEY